MPSKTSFFNKALFLNLLARFWPVWAVYALIWTIALPLPQIAQLSEKYQDGIPQDVLASIGSYTLEAGWLIGAILSLITCLAAAMAVFSYLYNAKSAGFIASLPIRREGMFVTAFTAGLTGLLAANVLVFALTVLVQAICGVLVITYLLQWLAIVSMLNVFFYGFACLCAMLTGHIVVLPLVYMVLNFTVAVVEVIVRYLLDGIVFGLSVKGSMLSFMSPIVYLLTNYSIIGVAETVNNDTSIVSYYMESSCWQALALYAAVGIVFAALALLLYRKRRMESASDVVAIPTLRPVFKYCMAFGCAVVLGAALYLLIFSANDLTGMATLLVLLSMMLIGGAIGYFAADMMMKKSFRVFNKRSWGGLLIFSACVVVVMFAAEFDVFGFERRLPSSDRIDSVFVYTYSCNSTFTQGDNIEAVRELHQSIINNKALHENASTGYYSSSIYLNIEYTLDNGSVFRRSYYLAADDETLEDEDCDARLLNELMNTTEAIETRKQLNIPMTESNVDYAQIDYYDIETKSYNRIYLTAREAVELYETCILPDMEDGNIGRIWLFIDESYYENVYSATFSVDLYMQNEDGLYSGEYFYTTVLTTSERTLKWLERHGITPVLESHIDSDYTGSYLADTVPLSHYESTGNLY